MDATDQEMLAAKLAQARERLAAQPAPQSSSGGWQPDTPKPVETGDFAWWRTEATDKTCEGCRRPFVAQVFIHKRNGKTLLDPKLCEPCKAEAEEAEAEAAIRAQVEQRSRPDDPPFIKRLEAGGISPNLYGATLKNFDASENPEARESVRSFVKAIINPEANADARKWLYLWGAVGLGKSHLLVGAARALHVTGYSGRVVVDSSPHLVRRVQSGYGKGDSDQIVDARVSADVWMLDDLGRGKQKDDAVAIISEILHSREGRWTFITSNYMRQGLPSRHEDYETLASRLGPRSCVIVEAKGRDRREDQPE